MVNSENTGPKDRVNASGNEWSIQNVLISYVKWIAVFLSVFLLYIGLELLIFGTEGRRTAYEDILEQSIFFTLLLRCATSIPKSKSCFTVVGKIAVLPLLLIFIFKSWETSRVDAHLAELCKRDGGTKIYETVALPDDQFNQYGEPLLYKGWNKVSDGYQFLSKYDQLKDKNPRLTRTAYSIVRKADQKVLGIEVTYVRHGGGIMWRPGPDPYKRCPVTSGSIDFLKRVFVFQIEKQLP